MKKHSAYWIILSVMVILLGCGRKDETLPEVVVDRSECSKCRMLLSDARYAAMIKTNDYLMFDDIGCMLLYKQKVGQQEIKGMWVRDYLTNTWIPFEEAIFYRINSITTPMEYGYIALSRTDREPANFKAEGLRIEGSAALSEDFSKRFLAHQ